MRPRKFVRLARVDGIDLVVREATGPAAFRIARQARLLTRFRHPGLPVLLRHSASSTSANDVTLLAGVHTLGTAPPVPLPEAIVRAGQVLATFGALHASGIVHSAVRPDHLVVGPHGGATVCGLGRARRADPESVADELKLVGAHLIRDIERATTHGAWRRRHLRTARAATDLLRPGTRSGLDLAQDLATLVANGGTASSPDSEGHLIGEEPPTSGEHPSLADLLDETPEDTDEVRLVERAVRNTP